MNALEALGNVASAVLGQVAAMALYDWLKSRKREKTSRRTGKHFKRS